MARSKHARAGKASKPGLAKSKVASDSSSSVTSAAPALVAPTSNKDASLYAIAGGDIVEGCVAVLEPGPVKIKQNSRLLQLPHEVKVEIYEMAVTLKDSITPIQIINRSNKFFWSKDQDDRVSNKRASKVSAVPIQAAFSLSLVCKEMYEAVSLGHLLYKNNVFDFSVLSDPITSLNTYLVAITKARRESLTTMTIKLFSTSSYNLSTASEMFALVASCKGLKHLTVKLDSEIAYKTTYLLRPLEMAEVAFRGLSLDFEFVLGHCAYPLNPDREEKWFHRAKAAFADTLALPRKGEYSLTWFARAHESVKLDVHGEGRLSDDKRPGIVASRTRTAVRKAQQLSAAGILPRADALPKYDLNGEFAYNVASITKCRRGISEDGTPTVMFHVRHCPTYIRDNLITANTTKSSWEDVKVLASADARTSICGFYKHHPAEFGKEMVLAIWKEYVVIDDDQELGAKWAQSAKASDEKSLEKIIKKQQAAEEAAAVKRQKAAQKAAKMAAAAAAAAAAASPAVPAKKTKGAGGGVKGSAKKT